MTYLQVLFGPPVIVDEEGTEQIMAQQFIYTLNTTKKVHGSSSRQEKQARVGRVKRQLQIGVVGDH